MDKKNELSSAERLARLDALLEGLYADRERDAARMNELRARGREKTAEYRQLFANKLLLGEMLLRLESYGLGLPGQAKGEEK